LRGVHANATLAAGSILAMKAQFGDIRVDGDTRQVWRGSQSMHLTKKAFELLLLLLERRPNAVSKEQIHTHLWPDTYVSESSVQALISEIRQAIGDDGQRRAVIRTVHAVGYAFSAEVASPASSPARTEGVRAWLIGELGRIPLRGGINVMGREGDDVIEIDDSTVSRRHAKITISDDEILMEDLGSKNGTWLLDRRVATPVAVSDGDVLCLGSARFTFRLARSAASTDSVAQQRSDGPLETS
jgi:DNA-binding winged helix-turn-helix (wHTH) protein